MARNARSHKADKVVERMGKKLNRQMVGSLVGCVHCGMCTESCHYVLANPDDPTYAPAYKADQIRKIFKRNFDWTGKIFPWWVHAEDIRTDEDLEKLKDIVFGKCTNCRRCSLNCPMGVDFATLNRMARGLLVSVGVMPEGVAVVSKDQWEVGNQMGVLPQDYMETLEWLSDELEDEFKDPAARIPIDKMDAEIVYAINPREVKYDPRTISDAARIFYLAGENWTMPSEGWDMTNFGLFSGDDELGGAVAQRVYDKVIELRGKTLVLSECGHGYRSTRCEGPNWSGKGVPFVIESSVLTMLRYIREGRIRVDKARNTEVVYVPRFLQQCPKLRLLRGTPGTAEPSGVGFPGDVSEPCGEFLLHRRGRGDVHVGIYASTPEIGQDQGGSAQGHRRENGGHFLPQLRRRPDRRDPALQAGHEGDATGQPRRPTPW